MTNKKKLYTQINSIFKVMLFLVFVGIIAWWSYPKEISEIERGLYVKSYLVTLGLTTGGALIGISLGVLLAFIKFKKIFIVEFLIDEYVDIMRGTPMILQLLIFSVIVFATWRNNFYVAVIALGLNSAAYVAEIVRSGIESIDKGQMEAARAIGMPYGMAMNEIVMPQAIKNILPALVNEFIVLFKETSIVGYISVIDITMYSKSLQNTYFNPKPIIFTGLIYYVSVKLFSLLSKILEGRLKRND